MGYTVLFIPKKKHVHSTPGMFAEHKLPEGSIIQCDCGQKLECTYIGGGGDMFKSWKEIND